MKFMFGVDYSTDAQVAKLEKERSSWWRYCWNRLWRGKHYGCLQRLAANAEAVQIGEIHYSGLVCDVCASQIQLGLAYRWRPRGQGSGVNLGCTSSGDDPERCTGG